MKYIKITLALTFLMSSNLYSRDEGFDSKLYKQLNQQGNNTEKNLFFSPHSIKSALNIVFAGARGKTEKEIAAVVGANNQSKEAYHSDFADKTNIINQKNEEYDLLSASKLFIDDRITIADSFKRRMQQYKAKFKSINFVDAIRASATINSWVAEKTREKIKKIVSSDMFSSDTSLAVLNAVYFKGTWVNPFKKSSTTQKPFYIEEDKSVVVAMMQQVNTFNYTESDSFKMVELPYKGNKVSMFIMLQKDAQSLGSIEDSLSEKMLNNAIDQLDYKRVDVRLPKFKMETEYNLVDVLKCLGMPSAFDQDTANFSGISNEDMHISDVVHKAHIKVDEQGTEAAAATAVIMEMRSACEPEEPVLFNADKPFIFFMRDNIAKATVFMGKVNNPNV